MGTYPPLHAVVLHEAMPTAVLRTLSDEGHLLVVDRMGEILDALTP